MIIVLIIMTHFIAPSINNKPQSAVQRIKNKAAIYNLNYKIKFKIKYSMYNHNTE